MYEYDLDCKLYLVSSPTFEDSSKYIKDILSALETGYIACFQLWLPSKETEEICDIIEKLLPFCQKSSIAFLINDKVDIAKKMNLDGVHIDNYIKGSIKEIRKKLGEDKIIGASCYDSMDQAMVTGEEGADYVSFGVFFPSKIKDTNSRPSLDLLSSWQEFTNIPCVAIGGITPSNCKELIKAGADFIAVSSYVWDHKEGPNFAITEFYNEIKKILKQI